MALLPLKLESVFFEALEYPEYARPNFFIEKQKESGWSKGVYLRGLSEIYHTCIMILQMKHGSQKRTNLELKIEDITIPIKDFQTMNESLKSNEKKINKESLDELHLAIVASYSWNVPEHIYSPFEILSYVEYALWFILNEFKVQAKEINPPHFRPRTETYFIYHVAQDGPFFDFPKFKATFHELILNTNNQAILKKKLKSFYEASIQIVELYNKKIFNLEQEAHQTENSKSAEIVRVEFISSTLKHSWWNDEQIFELKYPAPMMNQDLAGYASKIANLLAPVVLTKGKKDTKAMKKDFLNDFLVGVDHYLEFNDINWQEKIKQKPNHEAPYRDWFLDWFGARDYIVDKEPVKGKGRIDLKVQHSSIGRKKIEFKGWWNRSKTNLINQIYGYLTDFDGEGFIVLINTTGSDITDIYKEIICQKKNGFLPNEWKLETFDPSGYKFYSSRHEINGQKKIIYHFIISGPPLAGKQIIRLKKTLTQPKKKR